MDEELDFELDRLQQSKWEQLKSAARLALEHRQRVKEGDFSVFLMPLAFAIAKDAIFDFIPLLGWLFGFFVTVYLFIFLWGRGKWKVRLVIFFLSFFDSIPFVNFLPFQTLCVAYAYHVAKKDADRSKAALESLDKATPKLADNLRGVARQRALAASQAVKETASSNNVSAEEENGARALSQERPAQSLRMMAQSPRPQVIDAQAVSGQRVSRTVSTLGRPAAMAASGAIPQGMMDGARMQSAQVRGRAANDSVSIGAQPVRQQAVSGSDIAPTRVSATAASAMGAGSPALIPMAQNSRSDASATLASLKQGVSRSVTRSSLVPNTPYQSVVSKPDDAEERIREAGSRLSQLGRSPKGAAAAMAPAIPTALSSYGVRPAQINQASSWTGSGENTVPQSLTRSVESLRENTTSTPSDKVIVRLETLGAQIEEKKFLMVNEIEHLAAAHEQENVPPPVTASKLAGQIADAQALIVDTQDVIAAAALIGEAEAQFLEEKQDAAAKAYEDEQRARSVKDIMLRHNAFMVHGIMLDQETADKVSGENNALRAGVDPRRRIEILTALNPTLSTTTVRSGYTKAREQHANGFRDGMWSPFGVFLKGGKVVASSRQDAGSRGQGLLRREAGSAKPEAEAIDDSVTNASDRYNELITESPEVAGLYIAITPEGRSYSLDKKTLGILSDAVRSKSMPAYALNEKGDAFEVRGVDMKSGQLELGPQRSPEEVANNAFTLTQQEKEYRAVDIIDDAIFDPQRLKSKEDADRYEALQHGRMALVRMMHNQGRQLHDEQDGEKVIGQRTIRGLGRETSFVQEEGQLYRRIRHINAKKQTEGGAHIGDFDNKYLDIGGMIGGSQVVGEGENAYASPDALEGAIKKVMGDIDKLESEGTRRKAREQLAFFVHGIASEAPWTRGDVPTAERFKILEKSIAPDVDIAEFYRRRVGNNDQFIITKGDID